MTTSLKPLGMSLLLTARLKKWAAAFRRGRESMEDYERFGHPRKASIDKNVELVYSLIMCDRRGVSG